MEHRTWNIKTIAYLSVFVFCFFFGNYAWAVGVGVKPKEINLDLRAGKEVETEILVVNVSDEPAFYEVYLDAFENNINIEPSNFRLESSESQIVSLKVKINTPGRFGTNLSVVARPVAALGIPAGSGVKVPVDIVVSGLPVWWIIAGVFLIVCLLLVFVVILIYKKRKKNSVSNP